jgi:hypothetical protein
LAEIARAADDPDVAILEGEGRAHSLPICEVVRPPSMVMISPVM